MQAVLNTPSFFGKFILVVLTGLSVGNVLAANDPVYATSTDHFPPIEEDIRALSHFSNKARSAGKRLITRGLEIIPQAHIALSDPQATVPLKMQLINVLGEIGEPSSVDVILEVANNTPHRYLYQNALLALSRFEQTEDVVAFANKQLADENNDPVVLRSALAYYGQQPHEDAAQWVTKYAAPEVGLEVRFAALYLGGKLGMEQYKDDIVVLLNEGVGSIPRQYYLLEGLVELTTADEFRELTKDVKFTGDNRRRIENYLQFRKGDMAKRIDFAKTMLKEDDVTQRLAAVKFLVDQKNAEALADRWKAGDRFVHAAVKRAGYEIDIQDDHAELRKIQHSLPTPIPWWLIIGVLTTIAMLAGFIAWKQRGSNTGY